MTTGNGEDDGDDDTDDECVQITSQAKHGSCSRMRTGPSTSPLFWASVSRKLLFVVST